MTTDRLEGLFDEMDAFEQAHKMPFDIRQRWCEFIAKGRAALRAVSGSVGGEVDYVGIADRVWEATRRSIWPSTVKAVLEAADIPTVAPQVDGEGDFLPNGTRVLWQSSNGAEFPGTITGYNPASYNCKLDDGCTADDFARGRFKRIAAAPAPAQSEPPAEGGERPFKVGDRVRITHKTASGEGDWCDDWVPDMDKAVGSMGTVEIDNGPLGFAVSVKGFPGTYNYPAASLSREGGEDAPVR